MDYLYSQDDYPPFVFSVKTDFPGVSSNTQFKVPVTAGVSYACLVDWGDGSTDYITSSSDARWTHTYSTAGTYKISIKGLFSDFSFGNGGDCTKLLSVNNWGCFKAESGGSFYGCTEMTITAKDRFNFGGASTLFQWFRNCSDVETIPGIKNWDTSQFDGMNRLFFGMAKLNEPGLAYLDTSKIIKMNSTFENCTNLDVNLGSWDVSSLTSASNMLRGTTLSTANYDALLIGWAAQNVQTGVTFNGGNATYSSAAVTARNQLVNTYSWTITDGGPA
jgi:surface protein